MAHRSNWKVIIGGAGLCILLVVITTAFVRAFGPKNNVPQSSAGQTPKRVRRVFLWPQFQSTLSALGNRLEVVGKERLVLVGTIRRGSKNFSETPARIIVELPDRFRLEEQVANGLRITTFDGEKQNGLKRWVRLF